MTPLSDMHVSLPPRAAFCIGKLSVPGERKA